MLSYKELARLRKVRRYLKHARGAGAQAARNELDKWIAEEGGRAAIKVS